MFTGRWGRGGVRLWIRAGSKELGVVGSRSAGDEVLMELLPEGFMLVFAFEER